MTLDIHVVMGNVTPKRTSCLGYLPKGTRYQDIVRAFGKPQYQTTRDGKTQVEWVGKINDLVFTIYDYKSPVPPSQNTDWHIGAQNVLAVQLIRCFLSAKK